MALLLLLVLVVVALPAPAPAPAPAVSPTVGWSAFGGVVVGGQVDMGARMYVCMYIHKHTQHTCWASFLMNGRST